MSWHVDNRARRRRAVTVGADKRDQGQALVEFALVIPVLLLVAFGILRFGSLYNNYAALTNAVDAASRQLASERGQANPCTDVASVVVNAAPNLTNPTITILAQDLASSGQVSQVVTSSTAASGCPWSSSDTAVAPGGGELVSGTTGTVTAVYPWSLSLLGLTVVSSTMSVSSSNSIQ